MACKDDGDCFGRLPRGLHERRDRRKGLVDVHANQQRRELRWLINRIPTPPPSPVAMHRSRGRDEKFKNPAARAMKREAEEDDR